MHISSPDSPTTTTKPTVVLLHYTFGNHKNLQRHVDMFNSLGHTTVTFNLFGGTSMPEQSPFKPGDEHQFLFPLWIQQLTDVLDTINGHKILFTMSFPSIAGFIACSGRSDISKFICDSGPFTGVVGSIYRLYKQQGRFQNFLHGALMSVTGYIYLGPHALVRLNKALSNWSSQVPILSIRGGEDHVVKPRQIDAVFSVHKNLNFTGFEIQGAGHLDGLKNFPEVYTGKVWEFLKG